MGWIGNKYRRFQEIRRHRAGETVSVRAGTCRMKRLYLTDWRVLSGPELKRQEKHADHAIRWMKQEDILAFCEPYDLISFDVFDTLLCRQAGAAGNVFLMLEKENGIPDFAAARQAAERQARQESADGETTLRQIYDRMARNGTVSDPRSAMEAEWRMEKSLIAPHPRMLPLVKALAERGKRIIAVSDMYLSAAQIEELLTAAGYPKLHRVFVSCEEGAGKAGGKLYRRVQERLEGCGSARVLHMGDNEEADGACAAGAGWDTALLRNPALLPWEYFAVTPYGGDMIASALRWRVRYGGAGEDKSAAWEIGYTVAGPLTMGYCQWIRRMAAEKGWGKLLFCARDGWIMREVYSRYFGEADYLPVSRAAAQMLDVETQALSYCENNLPAHLGTGETVETVLRGMMLGGMLEAWEKDGLKREAPFDERAMAETERLILRDREKIAALFAPARQNALRWLRDHLGGVGRAAVIDTGWKGSAGGTLREFAERGGLNTVLDTVLMGTSRSPATAIREEKGELFSWLYSASHDRDRLNRQYEGGKSLACTLLEMLFMTTQPQLLSYAEIPGGEGRAAAENGFVYGEADGRFRELTEELQAGTTAFCGDYDQAIRRLNRGFYGEDRRAEDEGNPGHAGRGAGRGNLEFDIPAAAAYRFFEELILEKDRLMNAFGNYVFYMAPTPEAAEATFADRMRENGWVK